jgi:hypothetical protein
MEVSIPKESSMPQEQSSILQEKSSIPQLENESLKGSDDSKKEVSELIESVPKEFPPTSIPLSSFIGRPEAGLMEVPNKFENQPEILIDKLLF